MLFSVGFGELVEHAGLSQRPGWKREEAREGKGGGEGMRVKMVTQGTRAVEADPHPVAVIEMLINLLQSRVHHESV